jgi:hypothetical protein
MSLDHFKIRVIRVGFRVIWYRIVSGCFGSGWAGSGSFLSYFILGRVGLDFESLDLNFFSVNLIKIHNKNKKNYAWNKYTIHNYSSIIFKSFKIGLSRVSGRLISGHLRFRVVRVRVRSNFESSNFGLSRVSVRSGSGRVGFRVVWSWVISGFRSSGFGSGRVSDTLISFIFDFGSSWVRSGWVRINLTFKKNYIEFESGPIGLVFQVRSKFTTSRQK